MAVIEKKKKNRVNNNPANFFILFKCIIIIKGAIECNRILQDVI